MIRNPHRVRGASALGASVPGGVGPFGPRPDDGDGQGEPEPEPTSAVELAVQQRIEAAAAKAAANKRRRAELAEARKAGLRYRHAQRLRNLRDSEQRAVATDSVSATDEQPPDAAAQRPSAAT